MSSTYYLMSVMCHCFGSALADSALRCCVSHLPPPYCFYCRLLSADSAWASYSAASVRLCCYYCAKAYSVALRCCAKCCYFASYVSYYGCRWVRSRYFAASGAAVVCSEVFASAAVYSADAYRAKRVGCVRRRSAYTPCGARGCDSTGRECSAPPCRAYTNLSDSRGRRAVVVPKPSGCHSGSRTAHYSHRSKS